MIFTLAAIALLFLLAATTVALLVIWSLSNEVADDCARAVGKFRARHRLPRRTKVSRIRTDRSSDG